jgi:hypothetical protein
MAKFIKNHLACGEGWPEQRAGAVAGGDGDWGLLPAQGGVIRAAYWEYCFGQFSADRRKDEFLVQALLTFAISRQLADF